MKRLLLLLFLLPLLAKSQVFQNDAVWGKQAQRLIPLVGLGMPKDTFQVPNTILPNGQNARQYPWLSNIDSAGTNIPYIWNITNQRWQKVSSGSGGVGSFNARYSVTKGTGDSAQFVNDTSVSNNTTPIAYQIVNGRRGYYPVKADTADIFGIDSSVTFNNVAELKTTQLYRKGARIATTAGYYSRNDLGGASYSYNKTSTATPDDALVVLPGGKTVDSTGRWELIVKGRIRAAEVGIKSDGTNQSTLLSALTALSSVKEIIIDGGAITINSTVNFHSKKLIVQNGAYITGSGTIDSALLECDYLQPAFDTTLTVTNLLNSVRSVKWFFAVADYKEDGTSGTYTNNLTPFTKCYNAGVDLQLSDTRFLLYKDLYIPAARRKGYGYYLGGQWLWNAEGTVFGDGASSTKLFFPNGLDSASILIAPPLTTSAGFGGTVLRKGGQNQVFHDFSLYGSPINSNIGAGGYFDNKSHGFQVNSNNVLGYNFEVDRFLGDGLHVFGDVQVTPATNANNCAFRSFVSNMNAGSGASFRGGDGNNSGISDFNCSKNGRWGVAGYAFLGNGFIKPHLADNSYENQWQRTNVYNAGHHYFAIQPMVKYVWEAGNVYKCILTHERSAANSDPATGSASSTYWSLVGAGSVNDSVADYSDEGNWMFISQAVVPGVTTGWATYWDDWGTWGGTDVFNPQYDSTHRYEEGGGWLVQGGNDRSVLLNGYTEGDQHEITNRGLALIIGGFAAKDGKVNGGIGYNNVLNGIQALGWTSPNLTTGYSALISGNYKNLGYPFIGFQGQFYNLGWNYNGGAQESTYASNFSQGTIKFVSPDWNANKADLGLDTIRASFGVKAVFDQGIYTGQIGGSGHRLFGITSSTSVPTSGDYAAGSVLIYNGNANDSLILMKCITASVAGNGGTWVKIHKGSGGTTSTPTGTAGRIAVYDLSTSNLSEDVDLSFTANNFKSEKDTATFGPSSANLKIIREVQLPTTSRTNSGGSGDRTATVTTTTNLSVSGTWNHMINGTQPETGTYFTGNSLTAGAYNMTFDFGSGQSKYIDTIEWFQSSASAQGNWKMQGSDDGSTYTDVSGSFALGTSADQNIGISPSKGYRYYRLLSVSGNTSGSPWIEEIKFKINDASAGSSEMKLQSYKSGVAAGKVKINTDDGSVEFGDSTKFGLSNTANNLTYLDANHYLKTSSLSPDSNYTTKHYVDSADAAHSGTSPVQVLYSGYTDVGNTGTSETTLMSYTTSAGQLASDGDWIEIDGSFTYAANANTKSFKFKFGSYVATISSGFVTSSGGDVLFHAKIIRTGATSQKITLKFDPQNGTKQIFSHASATETLSGTVATSFTGQSDTASNDITQNSMSIVYYHYTP
jgi:hypothetical protein